MSEPVIPAPSPIGPSRPTSAPSGAPRSAYAALVSMTVLFGLSFVFTKYALRGFNPLLLALVRFSLAGAVLWLVWRLRGDRGARRPGDMRRLAPLGFVSLTVYFSLEISGIARTSASSAAILIATIPIFVSVINAVLRRERNRPAEWAGIVLSFAGVAALVRLGSGGEGGATLAGNLLVLGAALAAAVYQIMARALLVERPALYVTTFQNLFGALFSTSPSPVRSAPTCSSTTGSAACRPTRRACSPISCRWSPSRRRSYCWASGSRAPRRWRAQW